MDGWKAAARSGAGAESCCHEMRARSFLLLFGRIVPADDRPTFVVALASRAPAATNSAASVAVGGAVAVGAAAVVVERIERMGRVSIPRPDCLPARPTD